MDQAKKLRSLEKENARLKKLVADMALDNDILRRRPRETSKPVEAAQGGNACAAAAGRNTGF